MLQCGYRLSRNPPITDRMLQALLSDETLHPDVLAAGREAYSLAITHVCFHESEYSHVSPRSIGENLAKLIACRQLGGARSSENPGQRPYRPSIDQIKTPLHDSPHCVLFVSSPLEIRILRLQ